MSCLPEESIFSKSELFPIFKLNHDLKTYPKGTSHTIGVVDNQKVSEIASNHMPLRISFFANNFQSDQKSIGYFGVYENFGRQNIIRLTPNFNTIQVTPIEVFY